MSFLRKKHDKVRRIWYHSEALGQDMKAKLKRSKIDIIFQYKIVFLIDYVPENGVSVYSGEMTCSRSSGIPKPFCTLISTQKQAFAKFEK